VYVAVPGVQMDVSLIHLNRGDARGSGQYLGPDPYFDDLFTRASDRTFMSVEKIVDTAELTASAAHQTLLVNRMNVAGVIEAPHGAHFTSCVPDYERDEAFQRHYASAAGDEVTWKEFDQTFLHGDEPSYQQAVRDFHTTASEEMA
jgi:glutaconate CoA-transferase subunit A